VAFTAVLILVCVALQFSAARWLRIAGVEPDLLLLLTVIIGLLSGPRAGMATGFSAGMLEGAILGRWIGIFAATKALAGFLAGEAGGRLFVENLLVIMGVVVIMTLINEGLLGIFARSSGHAWWRPVLLGFGQAAYNGALALAVGAALRRARPLLPPEEPRA
jgi:rod shape-determining protein MreD